MNEWMISKPIADRRIIGRNKHILRPMRYANVCRNSASCYLIKHMETEANDIFPTGVWKINTNFLVIIHCIHRIAFPVLCNPMDGLEPTGIQESDRIGSDLRRSSLAHLSGRLFQSWTKTRTTNLSVTDCTAKKIIDMSFKKTNETCWSCISTVSALNQGATYDIVCIIFVRGVS